MEEGKDAGVSSSRPSQTKALPIRLLQLFALFLVFCITFSVISIYTIRHFGINGVMTTVASSFQPCLEEPRGLDRWIKPPSSVKHTMNDEELLWRASFTPRIKKYPFERVPKIAFMFLTKGPLPLAPLWERFLKGHEGLYSVYIHSLPSFQPHFNPSSAFYGRHIPSQVCTYLCNTESVYDILCSTKDSAISAQYVFLRLVFIQYLFFFQWFSGFYFLHILIFSLASTHNLVALH